MTPLVSIIVPLYNAEPFIAETIDSVLSQGHKNWEMLIVNDCSTDRSREIVNNYAQKDPRVKLIDLERNSGIPAKPRNIGIQNAKGKYISFLDADDIWLENKLEEQVRFLEANKDVFLLYSRYLTRGNRRIQPTLPDKYKLKKGMIFEPLFLSNDFIPCSTVTLRNKGKEQNYYFDEDKRLKAIEDFDLWLRISKNEIIAFIDKPLLIYRLHSRNISKDLKPLILRYLALLKKWQPFVKKSLLVKKYIRFSVYAGCLVLIRLLYFIRRPR